MYHMIYDTELSKPCANVDLIFRSSIWYRSLINDDDDDDNVDDTVYLGGRKLAKILNY